MKDGWTRKDKQDGYRPCRAEVTAPLFILSLCHYSDREINASLNYLPVIHWKGLGEGFGDSFREVAEDGTIMTRRASRRDSKYRNRIGT